LKKSLFIAMLAFSATLLAQPQKNPPLRLEASIPMPGVKGDFDHFGADVKGGRLFLAAEEHKTVEVFDLKTGKHLQSVPGFDAPHQIVYVPQNNTILVTDGGVEDGKEGYIRVISGQSYKIVSSIKVLAAADSAGYDPETHLMYADTGGTEAKMDYTMISVIDTPSAKVVKDIKVDSGRVEAIRFEHHGTRMFANLRTKSQVGVFDKKDHKLLATWDIKDAKENVSMALDEADHRLFVVCRKPAKLIVFDTESGNEVASLPSVDRGDDMAYNSKTKQIYVSGGDGFIGVYAQKDPDHYEEVAKVPSGPAAKISIFIPELNRLYVAASAKGANSAKLLIYQIN
jgi:DNA-binding beta-propeller fold protein YncE